MKNRVGTGLVLVALASLAVLTSTGLAQTSGKVEIKDDYILIHPGTKLSTEDVKALNDVLKKYDKSLYKIEVYEKGKATKTVGSLSDMQIDQKTVAELADAKTKGQSERAIQLIAPSASSQGASPTAPPTGPVPSGPQVPTGPVPSGPQTQTPAPTASPGQTAEFMERLKPILQKYSK